MWEYLRHLELLAHAELRMAEAQVNRASLQAQQSELRCRITAVARRLYDEGRVDDAIAAARCLRSYPGGGGGSAGSAGATSASAADAPVR